MTDRSAPMPVDTPRTSSGILLDQAIRAIGSQALAVVLKIDVSVLERIHADSRPMSRPQQRALARAVMTLSEAHPKLRRRATALLGQIDATEAFERGDTRRHVWPP